jgi:hypothetical protein
MILLEENKKKKKKRALIHKEQQQYRSISVHIISVIIKTILALFEREE